MLTWLGTRILCASISLPVLMMVGHIHCSPSLLPVWLSLTADVVAIVCVVGLVVCGIAPVCPGLQLGWVFPYICMSTSCSLCTATPLFVNIDIVPLLAVLLTLINEWRNPLNVSAALADFDNALNGSCVVNCALHVSPLATFTFLIYFCRIGSCACWQLSLVM